MILECSALGLSVPEREHLWPNLSGMHTAEPEALIDSPTKTTQMGRR